MLVPVNYGTMARVWLEASKSGLGYLPKSDVGNFPMLWVIDVSHVVISSSIRGLIMYIRIYVGFIQFLTCIRAYDTFLSPETLACLHCTFLFLLHLFSLTKPSLLPYFWPDSKGDHVWNFRGYPMHGNRRICTHWPANRSQIWSRRADWNPSILLPRW